MCRLLFTLRTNLLGATLAGGRIGFFQGDVLKLVEDIAELKPTIFPSVPRLLNRIYERIKSSISFFLNRCQLLHLTLAIDTVDAPGIKGALFRKAYAAKLAQAQNGGGIFHGLWDRLLFNKVAAVMGGKLRFLVYLLFGFY